MVEVPVQLEPKDTFLKKVGRALKPDKSPDAKWYRKPAAVYGFYIGALLLIVLIGIIIWLLLDKPTYEQTCLFAINGYRKLHGVRALTLNNSITEYAMEWTMRISGRAEIEYQPDAKYGQNIYVGKGMNSVGCDHVVKTWYNEIENYDFDSDSEEIPVGTGHFTQLVWSETDQLGCAALNSSDLFYVVCDFKPTGNLDGLLQENVKPPKGKPPKKPAAGS